MTSPISSTDSGRIWARELYFKRMVGAGAEDLRAGKVNLYEEGFLDTKVNRREGRKSVEKYGLLFCCNA